uniref:Uncharacterized protein n=1 Tax=Anguilla anguilla TaxID=7936 RepID=A0A0E9VDV0_ANGAN
MYDLLILGSYVAFACSVIVSCSLVVCCCCSLSPVTLQGRVYEGTLKPALSRRSQMPGLEFKVRLFLAVLNTTSSPKMPLTQ